MIPKTLRYGNKVESAIARSFRSNIAPQNGTGNYLVGDTIIVNIPTRNNLVLATTESYLKFNVTLTNTSAATAATFRLDSCGAHSLIQRLRIFHGSNLIQDIDNYGLLCKILFDLQQSTDSTYGRHNITTGTRADLAVTNNAAIQVNSGERFGGAFSALLAAAATSTETYCINLVSLLGSLSASNYIPLFAMTSAPLRLELQLVDSPYKFCAGSQTFSISVSNCEYVANFIELGDPAMGIIYENLGGGPLEYVVPDFRNYQFTQTITQNVVTQINMPIPAKFSSLKSIVIAQRASAQTAVNTKFSYSSLKYGLTDYQFRIGAQIIPSKPPASNAEFFSELSKCFGSVSDLHYTPSIDRTSYLINDDGGQTYAVEAAAGTSAIQSGSFYVGIDLENYTAAPKETIFAGMNTNTDDIYFVGNYNNTIQAGGNALCRFDAFANFDTVLVCENNIAYVKF